MSQRPDIKLLIVDEDEECRELLLRQFERLGCAVQAAANGEDALQLGVRQDFDAAIFELQLPGMSGVELVKAFKPQHPDCVVLILTGNDCSDTAHQAMDAGVFQCLLKPCTLAEVEAAVRGAIECQRLPNLEQPRLRRSDIQPDLEEFEESVP